MRLPPEKLEIIYKSAAQFEELIQSGEFGCNTADMHVWKWLKGQAKKIIFQANELQHSLDPTIDFLVLSYVITYWLRRNQMYHFASDNPYFVVYFAKLGKLLPRNRTTWCTLFKK